jgi:hypothetical protein
VTSYILDASTKIELPPVTKVIQADVTFSWPRGSLTSHIAVSHLSMFTVLHRKCCSFLTFAAGDLLRTQLTSPTAAGVQWRSTPS